MTFFNNNIALFSWHEFLLIRFTKSEFYCLCISRSSVENIISLVRKMSYVEIVMVSTIYSQRRSELNTYILHDQGFKGPLCRRAYPLGLPMV